MKYLSRFIPVLCIGFIVCGCNAAQQDDMNNDVHAAVHQNVQHEAATDENIGDLKIEDTIETIADTAETEPAASVSEVEKTEEMTSAVETAAETAALIASGYNDGTYEGRALGFNANVIVSVTVSADTITDIAVVSHAEDDPYWTNCLKIIDAILASGSTDVDAVSGATFTSEGIIGAVEDALKKAEK